MTSAAIAYEEFVNSSTRLATNTPHCDGLVLHDPGLCKYCGMPEYADLQQKLKELGLNWTGSSLEHLEASPAEQRRPLDLLERWGGNTLSDEEDDQERVEWLQRLNELLVGQ